MHRTYFSHFLTLALIALLGVVLLWPIYAVVREGFLDQGQWSLYWFREVFHPDAGYVDGLINSLWVAGAVTVLCLVISIPLALISESFRFFGKSVWLSLLLVPLILPPFVGALGLKGLLARQGGFNLLLVQWGILAPDQTIDWLAYPFWSVVALETLSLYPITFLNIQAALANIDPAMDEAARNLGAGPWRRFWRITLPLMRPGIFAGSTIVFIWAFTEIGTPLLVGYRDLAPVQVFHMLLSTHPEGDAYALVVVLLVMSVASYAVGKLVLGRSGAAMMAKANVAAAPKTLGFSGSLLATLPFAVIFALGIIPHVGVLLYSFAGRGMIEFDWQHMTGQHHAALLDFSFDTASTGGQAALSIVNSFKYSLLATGINIVLGFGIAYLAVRRRSWLTSLLDSLAMLPLAVPGLVMAFGYFALTQGDSPVAFLNPLENDPTPLLVIAYAVRRLPFLVRSCAAGLEQTSVALEEAASNLGSGTMRTMLTVVLPLLAANLIAGSLLVFSRSMLEVSDSLILAFNKEHYPITKAIWNLAAIPQNGTETASALGVWGMVLLIVTIAGASLALGKRLGALFRV